MTGKAGTGKTTFLKHLKETTDKTMLVLAPTGVAAINAGGQTIHSFFKIGFGPLLPNDQQYSSLNLRKHFKYNKKKIELINNLELLVIDEVSMVRSDLLDLVSQILQVYRNRNDVFGGIQTVLIGDVFQLPPVARPEEWGLLKKFYKSPFFFSSRAFKMLDVIYYELEKIYRQSDLEFIEILNRIRDNTISQENLSKLNDRSSAKMETGAQYITLATHNNDVNFINNEKLETLDSESYFFKAEITKDFPESAAPTERLLELKIGAQVMFVRNESGEERRFHNGTIGVVTELSKKKIVIKTAQHEVIEVLQEEWENIKYDWNTKEESLVKKVIGTWKQYPLRLAWAITVHKSQGLTFDHVIADLHKSFTEGQVYVALSRCTSLDGLVLASNIPISAIKVNPYVVHFTNWVKQQGY